MELIDLRKNKVIYSKNLGDSYYWEYKLIVECNDNNYCLINYDGSSSGYIEFCMESVSEDFISAFFNNPYEDGIIMFDKDNSLLQDYLNEYYGDFEDIANIEAILIPKEKIQKYLDMLEG